ncbi:MAG: Serine/threonine-protein kinase [Caeruleum heppii]|nr:MAG: Serine/threonine-protein kinase [Caeruleum heppii]
MGQGYSLTTLSAGSAGIGVPELSDLTYEKSLGTARFMKSIRARHQHGLVFVKVVMKPYASMKLDPYIRELSRERRALAEVPNALGYQRVLETSTNGYLVRQYLYSSLYDRMSTRPFLEDIEKKWLAFQLLCAVRDCHARDVFHGDIKSENTLVTSWNWLYLSDFSSSFKPTYLPEDNPADFSYYFDTSGRRTCYLAPERFVGQSENMQGRGKVTWAMDIFSVGCVIAELFLETPIFSLSQLYKYRKGEYDPEPAYLQRIEDKDVREMIIHMIQVEPESRYSADEYINFWRRKAFPEYFYSFLHQYMGLITDPSSGRAPVTSASANLGEADERINRVYHDFDKISYFLGYENATSTVSAYKRAFATALLPVALDIPNYRHRIAGDHRRPTDDGTLIFLTVVVSSMRNTARAVSRIRACDLLLAFAERLPDEAKLDRVLPYVTHLLGDPADIVKVAAMRTLTQLLALVKVVSPVNAHVFPEYILPRLQQFIPRGNARPKPVVRATYAACLATLAESSARFLDMMQALRADGSLPTADPEAEDGMTIQLAHQTLYDVARSDLVDIFELQTKALLTDEDPSVRRAFLSSVSSLCVFFGSSKANDVILSHLNTYLNDDDWMLRCAFFETVVGVATYMGGQSFEEFILPLMVQALTDPEEFVVEKVIRSLATLAELGLFQRSTAWELIDIIARFTMHPNIWVREAAAFCLSSTIRYSSVSDIRCIVTPLLRPYLKADLGCFTEVGLLDALKKPLSRSVLDLAVLWATTPDKGMFWNPARQQRVLSMGDNTGSVFPAPAREVSHKAFDRIQRNEKDEQWLGRLKNIGMPSDDGWKLLALRDYVWRVAHPRGGNAVEAETAHLNEVVKLKQFDVTPQTVFFDDSQQIFNDRSYAVEQETGSAEHGPHTIADALLDASMTIDDSAARRKRSHVGPPKTKDLGRSATMPAPLGSLKAKHDASGSPSRSKGSSNGHLKPPALSIGTSATAKPRVPEPPLSGTHGTTSGGDTSPAVSSGNDDELTDYSRPIRHRASAVSLLNRKDSSKAFAETGMTSTNAFGRVEARFIRDTPQQPASSVAGQRGNPTSPIRFRAAHTYEGNDPTVLRLLDKLYLENYPSDVAEFGPLVTPVSRRRRIRNSSGHGTEGPWRPEGALVAMFSEHVSAINRVVVAPDHAFFVTGSDDGTVKVWDAARLERNVAHRSRQTHKHRNDSKVKALCFIEDTHSFVSAATDGSIHALKVDYTDVGGATKYGKLRLLRQYQLPPNEYVVWMEHFKSETQSTLLLATNTSLIKAFDLRTMAIIYTLENPIQHGAPTCFCVDPKRNWLLLGTSHGILDLWDLRFLVRLKAWGIPGATPISRLSVHPLKSRNKWVFVSGGTSQGEVTVWDIEQARCREVYGIGEGKDGSKEYEPWSVDDDRGEGLLGRFATTLEPEESPAVGRGIRAILVGLDVSEEGVDSRNAFMLTGGSDRKIRFWDLARVESSMVVSGLEAEEPKPSYSSTHYTASPSLVVNTERVPQLGGHSSNAGPDGRAGATASAKRGSGRPPRSTIISSQQQQLLKTHLDSVLDVALLELPYGMTISVDRAGVIFVFQ